MFHYKVQVEVHDTDREIEFISLKRQLVMWLHDIFGNPLCKFGSKSCEQLAKDVLFQIKSMYGDRIYILSVSEDGENGAEVVEMPERTEVYYKDREFHKRKMEMPHE